VGTDARLALVAVTPAGGYVTGSRDPAGATAALTAAVGSFSYPDGWVGLVRLGDRVAMYGSVDGIAWTALITMFWMTWTGSEVYSGR
jgi:hypothetical protein